MFEGMFQKDAPGPHKGCLGVPHGIRVLLDMPPVHGDVVPKYQRHPVSAGDINVYCG
jgi:hypothetical protein